MVKSLEYFPQRRKGAEEEQESDLTLRLRVFA